MVETKTLLLVRTNTDDIDNPIKHSFQWAEMVKNHFKAKGWQVIDLAGDNAIKINVEKILEENKNCLFLFYGHGKEDKMIGQNEEAVIDIDNFNLLKNQKVYVWACSTALELGKKAQNISHFYLGYNDKIWFGKRKKEYADCLGKCANKGILAMLETDCTIEQARQSILDEYKYWFIHYINQEDKFDTTFAIWVLQHNHNILERVYGDTSATLYN